MRSSSTARTRSFPAPRAASSAPRARRSRRAFDKIIGFDMGGTSTDVAHFAGEYERAFDAEVAGVRLRAPIMQIHTVAAGGGSICQFDGVRLRVGPESAGANPGPASYRRGGPLTVTDCNVLLGRIQPDFFPAVFGEAGDQPLDAAVVAEQFRALAADIERATGSAADAAGRRRRLHPHRGREHGERHQEDFRAARPRRHRVHAVVLRRRGRAARLPGRRRARHADGVHPSARGRAVGVRHRARRRHGDAAAERSRRRWTIARWRICRRRSRRSIARSARCVARAGRRRLQISRSSAACAQVRRHGHHAAAAARRRDAATLTATFLRAVSACAMGS